MIAADISQPVNREGIFLTDLPHGIILTSSNENIFCVTGPLWGEYTGHRWIPLTKASDAELWYFLWFETQLRSMWRHHCKDNVKAKNAPRIFSLSTYALVLCIVWKCITPHYIRPRSSPDAIFAEIVQIRERTISITEWQSSGLDDWFK